jgi:RNA polymerase sigma-70 factor (ECF subfamily)
MKQEKAYLEAFEKYADVLYKHSYFRVSDSERARDLVADTFTRTWDYIAKGKKIHSFRPFLYRTLNHLIIDEYRRKKSESLDMLLEEKEVPEGAFEELIEGSLEDVEFSLDAQRLPDLLEHMPHVHKEAVVMRFLDGLMPSEIADILDIPVNTVSVRIHRGVAWLSENTDKPLPKKQNK